MQGLPHNPNKSIVKLWEGWLLSLYLSRPDIPSSSELTFAERFTKEWPVYVAD